MPMDVVEELFKASAKYGYPLKAYLDRLKL
jgi:hypothetical protein